MELSIVAEWLLALAISLFVYKDATANKIGRVKGERSLINFPAGLWAFATLLIFWFFGFIYLVFRTRLIERAEKKPIALSARHKRKVVVLLMIIGFVAAFTLCWPDQHGRSWQF